MLKNEIEALRANHEAVDASLQQSFEAMMTTTEDLEDLAEAGAQGNLASGSS